MAKSKGKDGPKKEVGLMKIAVASDDGKRICGHLGRCASFVVFEIRDRKIASIDVRENNFTSHSTGDCAHHHEPGQSNHSHDGVIEALADCTVVISQGMGQRIAKDLENAEIEPIVTNEENAEMAVRKYLDGKLEHFSDKTCGCGRGAHRIS